MLKNVIYNLKRNGNHWKPTEIEQLAESVILGEITEDDIPEDLQRRVEIEVAQEVNNGTASIILKNKKNGKYGKISQTLNAKTVEILAYKVMTATLPKSQIKDQKLLKQVDRSIRLAEFDGRQEQIFLGREDEEEFSK